MSEEKGEYVVEPKSSEVAAAVSKEIKPPLQIQVGMENGKVIVIFSQKLTTFSLPWDEAEKMADAIYKHAADARETREKAGT